MIGSHNTFSYLPVQKWWMRLLTPWHRCQSESAITQIAFNNVHYLDVRVRFVNDEPVLVHNNIIYKTPNPLVYYLLHLGRYVKGTIGLYESGDKSDGRLPIRLILDVRRCPANYIRQRELFNSLIQTLQSEPFNEYIYLDEARIFWDWDDPIIKSKFPIEEIHTSVCSKWYQYLLGTKWFAKKHNAESYTMEKYNPNRVYLIDYVNIHN